MWGRMGETDSGWVGAAPDDDLDRRLEVEQEPFDLARPHVRTLLGPIASGALGTTLVGEPLDVTVRSFDRLDAGATPREALLAELEDAYAAGVRAIVGLCRSERALDELGWLAGRSGVHLVAAAPPAVLAADDDCPIGAILLDLDELGRSSDDKAEQVVALCRERSLPVSVRAMSPRAARDAATTLLRHGLEADRLWVGGCSWEDDVGAAVAVIESGASVAFDSLYRGEPARPPAQRGEANVAVIAALVRADHAARLLLGSGIDRAERYRVGGGESGLAAVIGRFPLDLMEEGVEATAIQQMLVAAPARLLTIRAERG